VMLVLFFAGNGYALWKAKRAGEPPPEEPALGFGDVTLMGGLGLLLGWPGVWAGLTLAVLLGGAFSLLFLLYGLVRWRRLRLDAYIPYGPFLVLGALGVIWLAK
jgi:leader peptidase (prepilin peptidase)/N-methyltransferase